MKEILDELDLKEKESITILLAMDTDKRNLVMDLIGKMSDEENLNMRTRLYRSSVTNYHSVSSVKAQHLLQGYLDALNHVPCKDGYTYKFRVTYIKDMQGRSHVDYFATVFHNDIPLLSKENTAEFPTMGLLDFSLIRSTMIEKFGSVWATSNRLKHHYFQHLVDDTDTEKYTSFSVEDMISGLIEFVKVKNAEKELRVITLASIFNTLQRLSMNYKVSNRVIEFLKVIANLEECKEDFFFVEDGFVMKYHVHETIVFSINQRGQYYKAGMKSKTFQKFKLAHKLMY